MLSTYLATNLHRELFFRGSRTYYNATKFFQARIRNRVTLLYAFVRKVDNLVDQTRQDRAAFELYHQSYKKFSRNRPAKITDYPGDDPVMEGFVWLSQECSFAPDWIDAFFHSMALDLDKRNYNSIDETIEYMYGSAEVIGMFMARIMELPDEALQGARMLGRAMQYINCLRDIDEDMGLGRRYIPLGDAPFQDFSEQETRRYPEEFEAFMRRELRRFLGWQEEADAAFSFIPRLYRIPIRTASDMYLWTAEQLYRNPWQVYQGSLKPGKLRVIFRGLWNLPKSCAPPPRPHPHQRPRNY